MSRKIKLIWDFRGPSVAKENYAIQITGFNQHNDMYATAFLVVEEKDMIQFRDVLKPHRGEVYS
jgi:hypothetical protein